MSSNSVAGLILSKDRAMQLDAVLRSLSLHCEDIENIDIKVLYLTSDSTHEEQYNKLIDSYAFTEFIKETDFKEQVLSCIKTYEYVLFLVDDIMFVRDFSITNVVESLGNNDDALGFSLRLGMNTTYCYMLDHQQKLPCFTPIDHETLKFTWTDAEYDFNYPLEISSSVYRVSDIYPLALKLEFSNPTIMEFTMYCNSYSFGSSKSCILCKRNSIAFGNPINLVQNISGSNRHGTKIRYSVKELSEMFDKGYRIDVEKYSMFTPKSCNEEVELKFIHTS